MPIWIVVGGNRVVWVEFIELMSSRQSFEAARKWRIIDIKNECFSWQVQW